MRMEMESLARKKTWTLIKRKLVPGGQRVLTGKFVFKTKRDENAVISCFKARWVVRGFEQEYGIDYYHTFAGMCKTTSWRIILALAATYDLEVEQMDAVTAFLNGDIDNKVFCEIPPGYSEGGVLYDPK